MKEKESMKPNITTQYLRFTVGQTENEV